MYDEISPFLNGLVLELGSGIGNISRMVLDDRFPTVLSDVNSSYLDQLKTAFSSYSNLRNVITLDLQDPFFQTTNGDLQGKFDTIFLLNVIEHLKDDHAAVENCKYMLKAGGTLILLAPAYHFLYCNLDKNLGHYRRYTSNTLAALLTQNNMQLIEKKYFNLAGIAGWLLWGKLLGKQQLKAGGMRIFNKGVPIFRLADKMVHRKIGLSAIVAGKKI